MPLIAGNCDEHGMGCESEGALMELTKKAVKILNFTFTSFTDPNGNWGVSPKNGIYNITHGDWGGVMGKVSCRTERTSLWGSWEVLRIKPEYTYKAT